jgi:hypothetical protein
MMKFLLIPILLLQTAPSMAALILLDDVMSKKVQEETGVAALKPKQKIALEAWLNDNFELKTAANEQHKEQLMLSINFEGGKRLQLSDGSMWEIAPSDVPQSSIWITPFPINIVPSNNPDYPFLLVNTLSGVSVKARKAVATPQSPSPTGITGSSSFTGSATP